MHFQIDRASAPFHPYWPFSFKEARDLGLGFMEAVNRGLGIENARKFTVNPLVFLESAVTTSPVTGYVAVIIPPTIPTQPLETIVIANVIQTASTSTVDTEFSDVKSTHTNAVAIAFVKQKGIVTGQDGKFYPERSVSRAEILKMSYSGIQRSLSTDTTSYFKDVTSSYPLLNYINTARSE